MEVQWHLTVRMLSVTVLCFSLYLHRINKGTIKLYEQVDPILRIMCRWTYFACLKYFDFRSQLI